MLGTGALLFSVMYIQSIGSGLSSFGDLFIFSFFPIDLTNVLYLSLSTPVITSQRLQQFLEKHQIKPVLVFENLADPATKKVAYRSLSLRGPLD